MFLLHSSFHFDCSILSFQVAAVSNYRENRRRPFDSRHHENGRCFQNCVIRNIEIIIDYHASMPTK